MNDKIKVSREVSICRNMEDSTIKLSRGEVIAISIKQVVKEIKFEIGDYPDTLHISEENLRLLMSLPNPSEVLGIFKRIVVT